MLRRMILLILPIIMLLGAALYLTPAQAAGPYQAEAAVLGGGATVEANYSGYNGTGFANFPATGGSVEFRNVDGGAGGVATLQFRYALGAGSARTGRLTVNGASQNITFNPTGAWSNWAVKEVAATLAGGTANTIRLESTGQDLANVDQLEIKSSATPILTTPPPVSTTPPPVSTTPPPVSTTPPPVSTTPPPTCPPGTWPPPGVSISVTPTILAVGETTRVEFTVWTVNEPQYTLYADNYRIAVFNYQAGVDVYNESPTVRLVSSTASSAVLEAVTPGTANLRVSAYGEGIVGVSSNRCPIYAPVTVMSNQVPVTVWAGPAQHPYGGTPWSVPGMIQAENYDTGGEGVAYHDTTGGNSGNTYRTDGVDIEATTDTGGGHNVGWTAAGEWLEYVINVTLLDRPYYVQARVASPGGGGALHVEIDGVNVTGAISVPATGGWQTWTTVTRTSLLPLTAGPHVMRIAIDTAGFNLNWVNLVYANDIDVNLALSKPATSSSSQSASLMPNQVVDGNTSTRWSSVFSDPQWIQVDLGRNVWVNRVILRWEAAYARDLQIQVSKDGTTWSTVRTVTGNTARVNDLALTSMFGRYVRMYGTARATGYGYSLYEFEVYSCLVQPVIVPATTLYVAPTALAVGETTQVRIDSINVAGYPQYTLYAGSNRIALFKRAVTGLNILDIYNESPIVRFVSSSGSTAVLEAIAAGTTNLKVVAEGEDPGGFTWDGSSCSYLPIQGTITVVSDPVPITVSN